MRRCRGFTLVELLVVIGIIALLISILLPSLNKARNSARAVQCMSNARQLYLAITMYAGDNENWLPPVRGLYIPGAYPTWYAWYHVLQTCRYVSGQPMDEVDPGSVGDCPTVGFDGVSWGTPFHPLSGALVNWQWGGSHYGMNYYMTSNVPVGSAYWRRINAARRSPERALLMDGFHYGATKNNIAAYRHEGKANVVFCDGHAELRHQQDIPCDWNGVNDWMLDYFWGAERKD